MDEQTPDTPAPKRTSVVGLAVAGTLAGVVLGLSGMAFAAEEPTPTPSQGSTVEPAPAPGDCPEHDGDVSRGPEAGATASGTAAT